MGRTASIGILLGAALAGAAAFGDVRRLPEALAGAPAADLLMEIGLVSLVAAVLVRLSVRT